MASSSYSGMTGVMQDMYNGEYPYAISGTTPRSAPAPAPTNQGYFWKGTDGKVYVQGADGINAAGNWDGNTESYWSSRGFTQTPNSPTGNNGGTNGGGGDGGGEKAKVLDRAGLASLDALMARLGVERGDAIKQAVKTRDAAKEEKKAEMKREKGKYDGSKLSTLQDFSGALTDTTLNTRNTLENLMSSLSTLGLGGSRALTRQLLDAANMSNRKSNATQSTDSRNLDSAFNEYSAGNADDVLKIDDQYGYNVGEANKDFYTGSQDATYKKADIYGDYDDKTTRASLMGRGDAFNKNITDSTFLNPKYTGVDKTMATPELGDYTQDIAKYDTTGIAGAGASPLTPVASDGLNAPGNLAVRAIAVNDKDLGIKKKSENDLGYGV